MKRVFLNLVFLATQLAALAGERDPKKTENASAIIDAAAQKRMDVMLEADLEYRIAFAKAFQFADRVEVFLLDFSIGKDEAYKPKEGDATFPIHPYDKETKILKARTVPAKDVRKWCDALAKMVKASGASGALCHFPIHGVRVYQGNQLFFETSLCWHCNNYYFCYGPNGTDSGWAGLFEGAKDIHALFDDFMPIPETEKARFPGNKAKAK